MSEMRHNLPPSLIDVTLETAQRIERSLVHAVGAAGLVLANLELNTEPMDDLTKEQAQKLGQVLLRISSLSMDSAQSIAGILGENQLETNMPAVAPEQPRAADNSQPSTQRPAPETIPAPTVTRSTSNGDDGGLLPASSIRDQLAVPPETRKPAGHEKEFEGELYQAIVAVDKTPIMELPAEREPIEVAIIGDNTLLIDGEEFTVKGDRLFLFNAFMMLRESFITSKAIRELGFRPDATTSMASQAFSRTVGPLLEDLKQAAGIEMVKRIGNRGTTKYAVNPAIVLIDKRDHNTPEGAAENVKKNDSPSSTTPSLSTQ